MSENKKIFGCGCTCCGCGCLLSVLFVAALLFFGYAFMQSTGREFVADKFTKMICSLAEQAYDGQDLKEIKAAAESARADIKSGKIGLCDLLVKATDEFNKGIHVEFGLMALKNSKALKDSNGKNSSQAQLMIDKLLYNIRSNAASPELIASATAVIRGQINFESADGASGTVGLSVKDMSEEEKAKLVAELQQIFAENFTEPPASYNAKDAFKKRLLNFINNLRNSTNSPQKAPAVNKANKAGKAK